MIYTSYFEAVRDFKDTNRLVSIAFWTIPEFKHIQKYTKLAPTQDILARFKEDKNEGAYTKAFYKQVLNRLDPGYIFRKFDDKILLCYEKPGKFCHRHIVSRWLRNHGYPCQEMDW